MTAVTGQRVVVVGLAGSGLAAVRALASRGARVIANDIRDESALGSRAVEARQAGADLALGHHDPALFTSADWIVVSPGVPPMAALDAADTAGVPVVSEVELASWFVEGELLAVTGTNGKSTVTSLLGEMCRRTGRPTFVGGNLGTPLVDVAGTKAAEGGGYVVVEVSSFQLERIRTFRPHVGVLLNVSSDHLDRYASFDAYAAAKGRLFAYQTDADHAVVPAWDARCVQLARGGGACVHGFGGPDGEVRTEDGCIVNGVAGWSVPSSTLRIRGGHNLANACAAALAARLAGVPVDTVTEVLCGFPGLPHRMEHVRDVGGVGFYDDSKATNVGAAVAAIDGLDDVDGRVVLVAGGKDKGGSYAPLRAAMEARGRGVVLLGEAASRIAAAFEGSGLDMRHAASMEDAVQRAAKLARPGDVVLLAPACASFDLFHSFAERGDVYQRAVHQLAEVT